MDTHSLCVYRVHRKAIHKLVLNSIGIGLTTLRHPLSPTNRHTHTQKYNIEVEISSVLQYYGFSIMYRVRLLQQTPNTESNTFLMGNNTETLKCR